MGCGSSNASGATAPGRFADDSAMQDDARLVYDKKTGVARPSDGGKDDDGREDDFFEVEEATGE
jgi:hypothetical protein